MTSMKKEAWEWLKAIVIGVMIIVIIRSFLITNYAVSGHSMEPTLHNLDKVLVSKISYSVGDIDRLDVLVFHSADNEDFVKRVIGIPGDVLTYKNDKLFINNQRVEEPYLQSYDAYQNPDDRLTENFTLEGITGAVRIPPDSYFVLGDNRRQSLDSRYFQFVNKEDIVGKVVARYWPLESATMNFSGENPE
ncbi:signal peptidase I [Paenisporosarcina sp. HGH0030]|uniref:signal peptidase I n=2 Tax=Paenisporosarcina TaxID=651660 RepID=UPI00034E6C55|nr:signal peptidase I [Paenisporosarcina sp. HGH0030]EPD52180.1 signal peptidase I [Paenisporosarcina sp. HGH0030]